MHDDIYLFVIYILILVWIVINIYAVGYVVWYKKPIFTIREDGLGFCVLASIVSFPSYLLCGIRWLVITLKLGIACRQAEKAYFDLRLKNSTATFNRSKQ